VDESYLDGLFRRYPGLAKGTSSDWVFNALLCDLLQENGKAVGIMTNGGTWNRMDMPIRKLFVERKLIECVISLPGRMFNTTVIPTTLIVLSHNNDQVRMIDATELCQQGRRQNEFDSKDISAILEALHTDSSYSRSVSIQELRDNEYTLSLSRYVEDATAFSNGVPFESVIKSITRGAPCTASQLDTMVSEDATNMQYLMLANIQDGMIDEDLPYLSAIDPKFEKYCLKNGDLILSKNSFPYKTAVARVEDGQKILASGNLYVIELDETKTNPYYIQAFLDSEQGAAVLKRITVGAIMANIGVDKLKKINIPLPSMEEQNRIAQKYQAALQEIASLKRELRQKTNELHNLWNKNIGLPVL
jgi:type I restriction enzyme M protein